jgi:hypothetical protein
MQCFFVRFCTILEALTTMKPYIKAIYIEQNLKILRVGVSTLSQVTR